jgi:hypothetical protein
MARFGGNEFRDFSVPIAFEGRYFILEPGDPPLLTVLRIVAGKPTFEVLKNQPGGPNAKVTSAGVVTVTDDTGKFLYKVRPESATSVVFGRFDGGEVEARISDKSIQCGGVMLENCEFRGNVAGIVVERDGSVGVVGPIPPEVLRLIAV